MHWAQDGGLVIEDDYDAEHRVDRPPVPALRSLLAEHVCYAGSVSKLLAPALRVGWTLVPRRYADSMVAAKRSADLGNAVLPQLVLAELMESGELEWHLRLIRRRHRRRRDTMIEALRTHLPNARVHGASAGLHLTITLDSEVDDIALAATALEPAASRCSRSPGTTSAPDHPVSCSGTSPARPPPSPRASQPSPAFERIRQTVPGVPGADHTQPVTSVVDHEPLDLDRQP